MKATEEELALIAKIIAEPSDPTAPSILFEKYYAKFVRMLYKSRKFKQVEEDLIYEVVFDTLDGFIKNPQKFDSQRSTLEYYLKMDAYGNMKNSYTQQRKKNKFVDSVEDWGSHRNMIEETEEINDKEQLLRLAYNKLKEIFPNQQDYEMAKMVLSGVRETSQYSMVLGIEERSIQEQQTTVKKHKDRITKKLERSNWAVFTQNLKQNFL